MKRLQKIGLILAIVILVGTFFIQPTELLPLAARNTLGLLLAVIVLLVTEVFPIGITCLLTITLMVLFNCAPGESGTTSVPSVLSGYTNATLFFVLASFGISETLTVLPLSKRLLLKLMRTFGKNINMLLFAIMLCVALLSSVISNVAAAAVFIPIINSFLDIYEDKDERKRTARSYMIALPIASMIGGMMTPAGSSINMLAISQLESLVPGLRVKFVDWMLFGIPLAAATLPLAWLFCVKIMKPAPISRDKIQRYINDVAVREPLGKKEIYVLVIVVAMIALWILSSWFPVFNVTVVALIGLALFFIPGFEILTWEKFRRCVSWEAFFLMGTMISFGGVIRASHLNEWIAQVVFPSSFGAPAFLAVALIAFVTFVLLIPIPVAPALVTMLAAPLVGFAQTAGISPYMLMITLGLIAANCYLLPLDTVPLMTFATGSYGMFDMPKVSGPIQVCLIVISAVWIPIATMLIGV
ncbi:MAG: anion permease [Oscillospiraceae bacterium]|nr:anion permease [Oscillospiraceae bacterium]